MSLFRLFRIDFEFVGVQPHLRSFISRNHSKDVAKKHQEGMKFSKKAARKTADLVFKHSSDCQWPYNFTKAEFESFHGMNKSSFFSSSGYFSANKRVWEHGRDYYRIPNEYQHYEHQKFDNLDASSGANKLAKIALAINMDNLEQWERRKQIRNPVVKIRSERLRKQGGEQSDKKVD